MSQPFKTYQIKGFNILFFKTTPNFHNPDEYTILVYNDDGIDITTTCDGIDCEDCPLGQRNSPTHRLCPSYPSYLYNYHSLQKPRTPK